MDYGDTTDRKVLGWILLDDSSEPAQRNVVFYYNQLVNKHTLQTASTVFGGLVVVTAVITEVVMLSTVVDRTVEPSQLTMDAHYLVMNVFLVAVSCLLLASAYRFQRLVILLVGLGVSSWTLGHLYWTLYVYLAGSPITYPSVAELGFQAFYVLLIPVAVYLHTLSGTRRPRRLFVFIPILGSLVLGVAFVSEAELFRVGYSLLSLSLISVPLVLAINLLLEQQYRLFAAGVAVFASADLFYICLAVATPVLSVPFVDPLWYVSAAVIAVSLIRYERQGLLA